MVNNTYSYVLDRLKEICIVKSIKEGMIAGHLCRLMSPYCSAFFIQRGIAPNSVTILMILFGIVGSILFALPYGGTKIAGYICWYMWFTMDLSDGEVARYTQNFSKFGVEMDFMAHLIDHPLMNIALWLTFLKFNLINSNILAFIFLLSISIELVTRNIIAIQNYKHINGDKAHNNAIARTQSFIKYLLTQALLYPNFIIIFTPIVVLDWYLGIGFSLDLYIAWVIYCTIMFVRTIIKTLHTMYTQK